MRNSRTRKIPIMPVDEVKKKHRGFFDHVCNGTVYVCRWNDNAVVTLASNHLTHHPTGSVQRYSQSQKKHVKIRMPEILRRYNTSMGGVDISDKLLSSYRPRLKSKNLVITQGIAPREFHCPITSGFQKRYHNTFSPSKTSANHSDWTKSISTRNLENK
ncbi:PiggyBac transposable element-derived protein 3 [Trichinella patagoniensis]|uniref:PiggyBac transposable element-derived protein 3 n=1 Tax=Trichinella patagoniensis TaxID=990121 RepID=A0A0V1AGA4_9BILA|nr:PiggyBac transposable element-derived protein 3 [Trichinella patagoniensis]